ncbi:MAG: hypothetical protein ACYDGY_00005, partial [Acidimicrobiales bacterium]
MDNSATEPVMEPVMEPVAGFASVLAGTGSGSAAGKAIPARPVSKLGVLEKELHDLGKVVVAFSGG